MTCSEPDCGKAGERLCPGCGLPLCFACWKWTTEEKKGLCTTCRTPKPQIRIVPLWIEELCLKHLGYRPRRPRRRKRERSGIYGVYTLRPAFCRNNHPMTPENRRPRGWHRCRLCKRATQKRYKEKLKAKKEQQRGY